MPELVQSSWADEIDDGEPVSLPPPSEKVVGNNKIVTEYSVDEDGKRVKVVRTFRIEKKLVSKEVARRKALQKFGKSFNDRPGPDPGTTVILEEMLMNFIANKEESEKEIDEKSPLDRLKESNKGMIKCRICKEDHWTSKCPYQDALGPLRETLSGAADKEDADKSGGAAGGLTVQGAANVPHGQSTGKYVPPMRRDGARMSDALTDRKRLEDTAAIRVSNLSENAQEADLQELFKPFGPISRIFLAKDKITGHCKGFAFINYHKKEDAAKAIATLNGFGYDHLILNVEWAKPSAN